MLLNSVTDVPVLDTERDVHPFNREAMVTAHFLRARATFLSTARDFAIFCLYCLIVYTIVAEPQGGYLQTNSGKVLFGSIGLVLTALFFVPHYMKGSLSPVDDKQLEPLPKRTSVPRQAITWLGIVAALLILGVSFIESGQLRFSGASFWIAMAVMNATITIGTLFQGLAEFDFALKYQAQAGE